MTFPDENVDVAHSLVEAIVKAQTVTKYPGPVWICGGEAVYAEGLPLCDKLYITRIHADFEGDRSFPKDWQKYFSKLSFSRDSEHEGVSFTFEVWEK
jgi:dihydrofolate reductase